jgi:hypothetical protein
VAFEQLLQIDGHRISVREQRRGHAVHCSDDASQHSPRRYKGAAAARSSRSDAGDFTSPARPVRYSFDHFRGACGELAFGEVTRTRRDEAAAHLVALLDTLRFTGTAERSPLLRVRSGCSYIAQTTDGIERT